MIDRLRSLPTTVLAASAALLLLGPVTVSCSSNGDPAEPEEVLSGTVEQEAEPGASAPADLANPTPRGSESASPSIAAASTDPDPLPTDMTTETNEPAPTKEIATLGAGCFWCIEAVLEQIDGVESVVSGYMGGETKNPTYREVCTGRTGHAEVVQVTFEPSVISYKELLDWFWRLHDPTTLNRQGADVGTQYRSAVFTHSDDQARIATTSKKDVQPSFDDPIVTEVTPASTFYVAEEYHQGYYFDNTGAGYCRAVIAPKLKKLGLKY
ncbi:MAG: peptide-methionine (S)-S-oxide reductase MsrA [Planctomycetota bacterium]|nr:peptide-methionine (S)-S-oxide reductase MsrA [Planctomycetota bacterium]